MARAKDDPVVLPEYHEDLGDGPMTDEVWPERVKTIKEEGIGPRTPYPTGNPPDPDQKRKVKVPNEGAQPVKDNPEPTQS